MQRHLSLIVAILALCLATACETVDGSLRPMWTGSFCRVTYAEPPANIERPTSLIAVTAVDLDGRPLPGVSVLISLASDSTSAVTPPSLATQASGVAVLPVEPGLFRVSVSMQGFTPTSVTVPVGPKQRCNVRAVLRLNTRTIQATHALPRRSSGLPSSPRPA